VRRLEGGGKSAPVRARIRRSPHRPLVIMIGSLRYLDVFTKRDGHWYFAERKLILDWSETRAINAAAS
jgi:hypothetical protein